MTPLCRVGVALALSACLAGCVTPSSVTPSAAVTSVRKKVIAAERVKDTVTVGKSTKEDIAAALGETLTISFDNGYEIWVYRLANRPAGEFVILFTPSGLVAKIRIRSGS